MSSVQLVFAHALGLGWNIFAEVATPIAAVMTIAAINIPRWISWDSVTVSPLSAHQSRDESIFDSATLLACAAGGKGYQIGIASEN